MSFIPPIPGFSPANSSASENKPKNQTKLQTCAIRSSNTSTSSGGNHTSSSSSSSVLSSSIPLSNATIIPVPSIVKSLPSNGGNSNATLEKAKQKPRKGLAQLSQHCGVASISAPTTAQQGQNTVRRVESSQVTRLSSDSALSVDIETVSTLVPRATSDSTAPAGKKKRKIVEDDPSIDSSPPFQPHHDEENGNHYPQVVFAPPIFQSYDYFSYPQMMPLPQQFLPPVQTASGSSAHMSRGKQVETEEEYWKRKPIIAQFMEKRLGFTRYVIDRLDERELSHQFIHSLITAKDKTMIGSICMSLLSTYLQDIKTVFIPDLTFQDSSNGAVHFSLMGASVEYSALISRIILMSCDPDCPENKVADLLALSFMLMFNFGYYCRSNTTTPSSK